MLRKLYSYATVNVALLTMFTYSISYFLDSKYYLMHNEMKLRLALTLGQYPVHKFFLIPARSKPSYAKYLPSYIFYPLIMVCNIAMTYFVMALYSSVTYQYDHDTFKSVIGFIRFVSDITVLMIWSSVFTARIVSYVFGTVSSWFKLAW